MPQALDTYIFRVLREDGETVGTGFLLTNGLVVTCAHVVKAAGLEPCKPIYVHFLHNNDILRANILEDGWSSAEEDDIAFLILEESLKDFMPVELASASNTAFHKYTSLGFPKRGNYVSARRPTGLINGLVPSQGRSELLSIKGEEMYYGMSGSPILDVDLDRIIGMVSYHEDETHTRTVYAITADTIHNYCPSEYRNSLNFQTEGITPIKKDEKGEEKNRSDDSLDIETKAYPVFTEARIIQVVISQLFRMADFLTYPQGVRAKRFYNAITNRDTFRRVLNRREGFDVAPFGILKPVVTLSEQYDAFWKTAIPDLRTVPDPLRFIPFELDLTDRLKNLRPQPDSIFEYAMRGKSKTVQNLQLSGHLRIYPPGTGIIKLGMTLEFKKGVQIETVGRLAHDAEDLLFIDPNDGKKVPCETIFLDIINRVSEIFFKQDIYSSIDRRWQPPETTFIFRDFSGDVLDQRINDLAHLLAYAPANFESIDILASRVSNALSSTHWKKDKTFFVTAQGSAIVLCQSPLASGKRERQRKLLEAFIETRELVSAAQYAEKAFAEKIDEIYQERRLNDSWLNEENENFINLYNLLSIMQRVLRAVYSIFPQLQRLGKGEIMNFAKDLWSFNNPVDYQSIHDGLCYISGWLLTFENETKSSKVAELLETIKNIQSIPQPFMFNSKQIVVQKGSEKQESIEEQLLSGVEVLERLHESQASREVMNNIAEEMKSIRSKLDKS